MTNTIVSIILTGIEIRFSFKGIAALEVVNAENRNKIAYEKNYRKLINLLIKKYN